jgi:hypothetical protein
MSSRYSTVWVDTPKKFRVTSLVPWPRSQSELESECPGVLRAYLQFRDNEREDKRQNAIIDSTVATLEKGDLGLLMPGKVKMVLSRACWERTYSSVALLFCQALGQGVVTRNIRRSREAFALMPMVYVSRITSFQLERGWTRS